MNDPDKLTGALDLQVGGNHYKKGIQPFALSFANNHDGCTHAIQKYMTRHSRKDPEKGYQDCQKAHHITGIRLDLIRTFGVSVPLPTPQIAIEEYVKANELSLSDAVVVFAVEAWHGRTNVDHKKWHDHIRRLIRQAAETTYPNLYDEKDFV
jgi:hypothetical protein